MRTAVWAHPVSFLGDGWREAQRLRDEGVEEVRLALVYHSGRWLLTTSAPGVVTHLPSGTWFQPKPEHYGRLRPSVADPTARDKVVGMLGEHGLSVNAWLVGLHSTPLASANPDLAVLNVFGHRYRHALCPANPDVESYAANLVRDVVTNSGIDAVELEAFGYLGWAHASEHDKGGADLRPVDRWLLSLCVCPSCSDRMRRVGIDPDALAHRVRLVVQEQLREPQPAAPETSEDAVRALGEALHHSLIALRSEVTGDLMTAVTDAVRTRRAQIWLRATGDPYHCGGKSAGDLARLAKIVDGLTVTNLSGDVDALDTDLDEAQRAGATRLTAGWSLIGSHTSSAAKLVEVGSRVRAAETLCLYGYDLAPSERVGWMSRAIPREVPLP